MTRILEIVGTKVKQEIDACDECPCFNDGNGGEYAYECQITGIRDEPLPYDGWEHCPLPEKKEIFCPECGSIMHPDYNFDDDGNPIEIGHYCRECLHSRK